MNAVSSLRYRVRQGYQRDARAVRVIFVSALREHGLEIVEENVNAEIANFGLGNDPTKDEFVAVTGRKICGFLVLGSTTQPGCGELLKVFVDRSHRRRGVGSMLIEQCIERAKERGYRELLLQTYTTFAGARLYYEKHGWTLLPHWPVEVSTLRIYRYDFSSLRHKVTFANG